MPSVAEIELMDVIAENELLRAAITRASEILQRNLGHQTEKCYDALAILRCALEGK